MTIELLVSALVKRFTDLRHQIVIEIKIVKNGKAHTKHLVRLKKMADIASGIEAASGALAIGIDRQRIALIFLVIDVHRALPCEDIAMAGIAGWHDAVEEIHAAVDRL